MLTLTFDPENFNFIAAGDDSYFLLRLPDGERLLLNDRCAHRGGPLHLGEWNETEKCLVCPWHQTSYREKALHRLALPLVYSGGQVTVVLDAEADAPVRLSRKVILAAPPLRADETAQACNAARGAKA